MTAEGAAEPTSRRVRPALPKLGTRVRFVASEAPRAARQYGTKVGTIVTRNHIDGEVGLTFGWASKRTDEAWRWSGGEALVWAAMRELEIVN